MTRSIKREVKIGNVVIGGNNKIAIQSMTNTKTKDVKSTVKQINDFTNVGCDIVRVSVLDSEDAIAIKEIKKQISIPLVADIHFDYKLALEAINSGADKIRLNPGNIGSIEHVNEVVLACKEKNIPIRIGVNTGSINKDIAAKYGHTAKALVMSAKEHVDILESLDFHDIVISLKASDVNTCIEAYKLANAMFDYPLHIGITEAGTFMKGTVLSSVGLGILLNDGIGDTIRVSLTDDPLKEVLVAKEILSSLGLIKKPILVSCPTCGRCEYNMFPIAYEIEEFLNTLGDIDIKVAVMGCIVNGPGEAKDADVGVAGGKGEALLFIHGVPIRKIKEEDIVSELKKEILNIKKDRF